ncbi:MAG: DUF6308 family protein [Coriobacteriia bacterium]|nr:DUF6308 family protein [Coriobacteriia bacterium]
MADTLVLSPSSRVVNDCESKLQRFRDGYMGYSYVSYRPQTPTDRLLPEDLAVTLAFNSRATGRAFESLVTHGGKLDLSALPDKPLANTTATEREAVASAICQMTGWPGFRMSLATKTLHKKRPNLIPVLDNRAMVEAYLRPDWPDVRTAGQSWWGAQLIRAALDAVHFDLLRQENLDTWKALAQVDEKMTQIELLDAVWWVHFRDLEPVRTPS